MKALREIQRLTANDSNLLLCSKLSLHMGVTSLKELCISTFRHVAIYCASNSALKQEEDVLSPVGVHNGFVFTLVLAVLYLCSLFAKDSQSDR